jgi:hypothetical protein
MGVMGVMGGWFLESCFQVGSDSGNFGGVKVTSRAVMEVERGVTLIVGCTGTQTL